MTIEDAIKTALDFENKVHALYEKAAHDAHDATAKKVFTVLAQEEQGHVAYLESRLAEWQKDGHISSEKVRTVLPSAERVKSATARLRKQIDNPTGSHDAELASLQQALQAEDQTSAFYLKMVRELPAQGQELFSRFLAIEEGHAAVVQAQIDNVKQMGFWFDMKEFDLENG
jgi:rubrerythrin